MNILLIVASGKSSRFGGDPKAFCKIGKMMNAENTIIQAKELFDEIYIGVNQSTYNVFNNKIENCHMFSIKTGQGDAHSLLKCLMYIKEHEKQVEKVVVCWGDALFVGREPFEVLVSNGKAPVNVACALDPEPYAWFDVNSLNEITKSHFAKNEGVISCGIHDQSLFSFELEFAIKYLNEYREVLGIENDNDESTSDVNEMKLLNSFEFLQENGYAGAKVVMIPPKLVRSFNTQDELREIIKELEM